MQWDQSYSSSEVEDRRAEGGADLGGGTPVFGIIRLLSMFGWKGILVGLVIAGVVSVGGRFTHHAAGPVQSSPQEDELVHFVGFVLDDVQKTWRDQLPGYQDARLAVFRRAIRSACGTASSAVGPFYCQSDRHVYIDLEFYDELKNRFGAPGEFAQAYVIAHEVGHHVQNLKGLFGKGTDSIHIELQADCLAGAWAKDADRRGIVQPGDIDSALNAASQIGDDTLQRKETGHVQPETWTHGSAAQRSGSFKKGFEGGAKACGI